MDTDKISLFQQFIQCFTFFGAVFTETCIGNIRIISYDLHPESLQSGSHQTADTAKADDAQSFTKQLAAF